MPPRYGALFSCAATAQSPPRGSLPKRENITNLLILGFLFFISIVILSSGNSKAVIGLSDPTALETHAAIAINGDAGFTAPNGVRSGTGTFNDPFIISDWEIDAKGSSGINIIWPTKHFRIQNCLIYNSSYSINKGIFRLEEPYNGGGGSIWNCEFRDSTGYSINFNIGNNLTINNTLVKNVTYGILFYKNCSDIQIKFCDFDDINGGYFYQGSATVDKMHDILIANNTFTDVVDYTFVIS